LLDSESENESENTQDLIYSKNDAKANSSEGDLIDLDLSQSTIDRRHFREDTNPNLADEFLASEIY
jgi:hypothetical protein